MENTNHEILVLKLTFFKSSNFSNWMQTKGHKSNWHTLFSSLMDYFCVVKFEWHSVSNPATATGLELLLDWAGSWSCEQPFILFSRTKVLPSAQSGCRRWDERGENTNRNSVNLLGDNNFSLSIMGLRKVWLKSHITLPQMKYSEKNAIIQSIVQSQK